MNPRVRRFAAAAFRNPVAAPSGARIRKPAFR
jgi:hypothetical protein